MLCDDTSKEVAGTYRSFTRVLLHRYPLYAVTARGAGLLPPGSRMQQSHNPRHLDYGDSFPTENHHSTDK